MRTLLLAGFAYLIVVPAIAWVLVWHQRADRALLNVSYDPTRELWRDLNRAFRDEHEQQTGQRLAISMSHGSSGGQARSVIDGLDADVVSLALWSDTDAIRRAGLIEPGWESRGQTHPYYSTIVFVVRVGNPKNLRDWADLIRPGVSIITPSPKTSGNGKLTLLAAWGAILKGGGTEADAEAFIRELYRHAPVLDTSARGAAMTFSQKNIGDVHLAWENEAHLEVQESGGRLEIVYPRWSIRADPPVVIVDANVDRHGTREAATRYVAFLFSKHGQQLIARHYFRPADDSVRDRSILPDMDLFDATLLATNWDAVDRQKPFWDEVQRRFFAEGGLFDRIYQGK